MFSDQNPLENQLKWSQSQVSIMIDNEVLGHVG